MKKSLLIIPLLLLGACTFANEEFPAFPMTIHGNIKIGSSNLNGGTLKVYNSSNQELTSYTINQNGKYGSDNVTIEPLLLNKFNGSLYFKVLYNGKTYIIDTIDDSNKGNGCPSKSSITFVSENCRYDLTLKEEQNSDNSMNYSGGGQKSGKGNNANKSNKEQTHNSADNKTETKEINEGKKSGDRITNKDKANAITPAQIVTYKQREQSKGNSSDILENGYTREMNNAYEFCYKNGIIKTKNIEKAKMNSPLTRIAMAKMLSNYAINVLGKKPDTSKGTKNFNDVTAKQNADYDNAVTLSYQLGIMGQGTNNFRPNDEVTRAEFTTALSRMLYGTKDGQGNKKYYETHIAKLYDEGIIKNTNPKVKEKRGYVMTMLMRTVQ